MMLDDPPFPGPASPALPGRRRRRPAWSRRLLWAGGAVILIGISGVVVLRSAVNHYLKSSAFTSRLTAGVGRFLQADCRMDDLSWMDTSAHAGSFTADGRANAAFQHLEVSDLRADFDMRAIWDRVWRVRQMSIAQARVDFLPGNANPGQSEPKTGPTPRPPEAPLPAPPGWLARWLPDRTEVGPVTVDRFDFSKPGTPESPAWGGKGFALELKPELKKPARLEVSGHSGALYFAGEERKPLQVSRLRGTVRPDGAAVDQFEGRLEEAQVSAEGTVGFQNPGDLRLHLRLIGARLDRWLPEDWLKRCQGTASAKATLTGDWRQPQSLRAAGEFQIREAAIQALPLLDIIARKTQNASFLRMQVRETSGQFERRPDGSWLVRQLRADAPGLLRLKGSVATGARGALQGDLLLGIVPGTLRYLAGAEQTVFLSADRFRTTTGGAGELSPDDTGLLWTRFALHGTLEKPEEDLSERLARAWFNATVDQVTSLSMEAAATAARTAAGTAGAVLQNAPPVLEKAPDLLKQGVEGGLKVLDNLLPR